MEKKRNTRKKPLVIKEMQGTLEKSKEKNLNPLTGEALKVLPPAPEFFDEEVKRHWDSIVRYLFGFGILYEVDLPRLIDLCLFYETKQRAIATVRMEGAVKIGVNAKGEEYEGISNSWVVYRQATENYNKLAALFALSPLEREKISMKGKKDENDSDFD